ncbi:hypothetical protein BEN47_18855 [Hymenobacter lapidarius]|uniref:DUF4174 domain-containing protein n=1 Tax=Hymenobacter lapidarius TaxID=1908237 RepID=A0A1G1STF4_9BACT|nr:DUF4174 domain-containing protein [Hymenobacter lapidarius]OGX81906.1 hypothetical protein BEN47_18855 [Hymenobacter lapidarius]
MQHFLIKPRVFLLLGLLPLLGAWQSEPSSLEQTLRRHHWQKRVLLLASPTPDHPDFEAQKALLAAQQSGLATRDFLVLDLIYTRLSDTDKQFLAQKTGVLPQGFAAVLIGKDGGVKLKSTRPIVPATLFGTVDKMPMRRQEMRRGVVEH